MNNETALQWEIIDGRAMQFKRRIRPVILTVTFSATADNDPLLEAIDLMKWAFRQKKSLRQFADFLPTYFIRDHVKRYLYLLDYIDSPALRRGENYHQLRRAVSYANFGKLRFKAEHEQQIWNECSRLNTNCIIYYNAVILSDLLQLKERQGDARQVALLEHVSPVAWQHINFHGRFEFRSSPEQIDIAAMVQELARYPIQSIPVP